MMIFNSSELFYFFLDNETLGVVNNVFINSVGIGVGPSLPGSEVCQYRMEYCW